MSLTTISRTDTFVPTGFDNTLCWRINSTTRFCDDCRFRTEHTHRGSTFQSRRVAKTFIDVWLFSEKQYFEKETCGDNSVCDDEKACYAESKCRIEGCGPPGNILNQKILGNMYTIGCVLMVVILETKIIQVVCQSDGSWHYDFTSVCADVSIQRGIQFCDHVTDGGRWIVFQRRQDGSEDFYRDCDDYVKGFGHPSGEYWLGLGLIHHITTSARYELRIYLEDFEGGHFYAGYGTFSVDGPDDNYRLHVDSYTGTAVDCFNYHDNLPFSTYDNDNDLYPLNCAKEFHGAWWYNACHISNLNGLYSPVGNVADFAKNVCWRCLRGYYYSFKRTEMKIRRIS